jgi:hypothetical protein
VLRVRCQARHAEPGRGRTVCTNRWGAAAVELSRQAKAARRTPEQEAILASLLRVNPGRDRGIPDPARRLHYSFTRERLAVWGVPLPPPAGWRRALLRDEAGSDDS